MSDELKIIPRDRRSTDALEVFSPSTAFLPVDFNQRETHLRDYLIILRKHMWVSLTFLLTLVTIVTIATFKMVPVYTATARIAIDRDSQNILPFQDSSGYDYYIDVENFIETQSKVLQSETVALMTIKSLGLANHPEYAGMMSGPLPDAVSVQHPAREKPAILGAFLGGLNVRRVPNSRLLDVTFESTDPKLAAQVVNAHLENFVEHNFRSRYQATSQATKWLST
ncbi:MAG TPA: Wzz/FepE/Etk N-terminal domain-containing protein, partial [Candidatus Acidoferrales bacterium]